MRNISGKEEHVSKIRRKEEDIKREENIRKISDKEED